MLRGLVSGSCVPFTFVTTGATEAPPSSAAPFTCGCLFRSLWVLSRCCARSTLSENCCWQNWQHKLGSTFKGKDSAAF
uniref:Putative secreted protein n=1 Tax=Anopheles marajoara TaxID=58244 RepID=A0A2M4CC89_9DIPT